MNRPGTRPSGRRWGARSPTAATGLALALAACAQQPGVRAPDPEPGRPTTAWPVTVARIVDGDTFVGRASESPARGAPEGRFRVRLLAVDTPEPGTCYAAEARGRLAELLPPDSTAHVVPETEPKDEYGRYLLQVWNADGTWVNRDLVATGHAEALPVGPNDARAATVGHAENRARTMGRGLWGECASAGARERGTGAAPDAMSPPCSGRRGCASPARRGRGRTPRRSPCGPCRWTWGAPGRRRGAAARGRQRRRRAGESGFRRRSCP
ncbi:thermonuclease family protein [Haloactinospora alba]|uniref:thermonuclease family protein n=1 Tax=Haloactinospora alba TaxID=405555 RepID=UPI00114FEA5F